MAIAPADKNILIPDSGNDQIVIFTENGTFVTNWISFINLTDEGNNELSHPHGIAIDSKTGNVCVVDRDLVFVQKFDSEGNFITKWGSKGTADGQFLQPEGIAVDPLGEWVVISDTKRNTVSKFSSN